MTNNRSAGLVAVSLAFGAVVLLGGARAPAASQAAARDNGRSTAAAEEATHVRIAFYPTLAKAEGGAPPVAPERFQDQWFLWPRIATVDRASSLILDLQAKQAYFVDHDQRSYLQKKLPLVWLPSRDRLVSVGGDTGSFEGLIPGEFGGVQQVGRDQSVEQIMRGRMLEQSAPPALRMTVKVAPTVLTRQIGEWPCDGFDVSLSVMGTAWKTVRVWTSAKVPSALAAHLAEVTPVLLQAQLRLEKDALKELSKVKGFPLAVESPIGTLASQAVEISVAAPPPGVFVPPPDYTKQKK